MSSAKTLEERLHESGDLVAYQDWDSGGPGAGAGRVSVYCYRNRFYVIHDAGMNGPYKLFVRALRVGGIEQVSKATVAIWRVDKGLTYERSTAASRGTRNLLDRLQTPPARKALKSAFAAKPQTLGRLAATRRRRRG